MSHEAFYQTIQYNDSRLHLNVEHVKQYLDENICAQLYASIMNNPNHFHYPIITKKGLISKKRNKTIYGSIPSYRIVYKGVECITKVHPWTPELKQLCDKVEEYTGEKYNTCVVCVYNSGETGIKPHRDKEMKRDSTIASVSLGQSRTMRFEKQTNKLDITLDSGDLCLIKYPTNEYWLHSIPTDASNGARISVIFRHHIAE